MNEVWKHTYYKITSLSLHLASDHVHSGHRFIAPPSLPNSELTSSESHGTIGLTTTSPTTSLATSNNTTTTMMYSNNSISNNNTTTNNNNNDSSCCVRPTNSALSSDSDFHSKCHHLQHKWKYHLAIRSPWRR